VSAQNAGPGCSAWAKPDIRRRSTKAGAKYPCFFLIYSEHFHGYWTAQPYAIVELRKAVQDVMG